MNYLLPLIAVLLGFSVFLGVYLARDSRKELKNRKDLLIICKKLLKIIDVSHPQQSDAFFQELEKLLHNNLYTSGLLPGFLSSSDKKNLHQADEMIKIKNLKITTEFAANLQSTIQSIEAFLGKSFQ